MIKVFATLTIGLLIAAVPVRAEVVIAPHRAAYSLELIKTSRSSTITSAVGGMIYACGETCEGWTVDQQFILTVGRAAGESMQLTAISSTFESKDGLTFRFNIKRERNGRVVEKIRGSARLGGAGKSGKVTYQLPETGQFDLPAGTVFPTLHTLRLMRRAKTGARTDRQLVFDGSEIKPPSPVSAFILPSRAPKKPNPVLKPPLGPFPVRLFNLAFFDAKSKNPEPEFEMSIKMQDNGVAPSLVLDYGDYRVGGNLIRIESLDKPSC